jgi:hypothetical protein
MVKDTGKTIDEQQIEFAVFNAKHNLDPAAYDIIHWKRQFPQDVSHLSNVTLIRAMAYANTPADGERFCRETLQNTGQTTNENASHQHSNSIDAAIEPLKRLKNNLNVNSFPNLCVAVREYSAIDIHVSRLKNLMNIICRSHCDMSMMIRRSSME